MQIMQIQSSYHISKITSQCYHVYSEISLIGFSRTYSQVSMHRILAQSKQGLILSELVFQQDKVLYVCSKM